MDWTDELDRDVQKYQGGWFDSHLELEGHPIAQSGPIEKIRVQPGLNFFAISIRRQNDPDTVWFQLTEEIPVSCVEIGEGKAIVVLPDCGYIVLETAKRLEIARETMSANSWAREHLHSPQKADGTVGWEGEHTAEDIMDDG